MRLKSSLKASFSNPFHEKSIFHGGFLGPNPFSKLSSNE
jgi:hypothetical protein